MDLVELMRTDSFKSFRLSEQIYLILHKKPIDIGERTVQLSAMKAAEIAEMIIGLIKNQGDLYQAGETEEITFGAPTWFITIEDAKM